MDSIEKIVKKMLIEEPFYGFMLTTLERRWRNKGRIAVRFTRNLNAELLINRQWFEQFDDEVKMNLIKHELLHIAFKHLIMSESFTNKDRFNRAADLEVNCYLGRLPDDGCFCSNFGFPEKQGTVWYYNKLTEIAEAKRQEAEQRRQEQQQKQKHQLPQDEEQPQNNEPPSWTDEVRAGNKQAKSVLYRLNLRYCVCCAKRYISDKYVVKPLIRKAFEQAFSDIEDLQLDDYGFKQCVQRLTADICAKSIIDQGPLDFPEVTSQHIPDTSMKGIPGTVIAKILCSMPTGYRVVFNQLIFEHKSLEDTALMTGVDESEMEACYETARQLFTEEIIKYKNE